LADLNYGDLNKRFKLRFKSGDFLNKKSYNLNHKDLSCTDSVECKKSTTCAYVVRKFSRHSSICALCILYFCVNCNSCKSN